VVVPGSAEALGKANEAGLGLDVVKVMVGRPQYGPASRHGIITPMSRRVIMERRGKLSELDRSFDLAYWQAQSSQARLDAAWELVLHYARVKGFDVHQLRLQRSVESFQKQER
jgi:hypothetical protein